MFSFRRVASPPESEEASKPIDREHSYQEALRALLGYAIKLGASGSNPTSATGLNLEALKESIAKPQELLAKVHSLPVPTPPDFKEARAHLDAAQELSIFASGVLTQVPAATENAAFSIIERFEAVHAETTEAAESARKAKGLFSTGAGSDSVISRAEASREAIANERHAMSDLSSKSKKSAKGMRSIRDDIASGIDLLRGIEEITERSRLIAFNLAVEAAHFGDKGRGFKIIAGELRSLNDRTEDFSKKVTELLVRLSRESSGLVEEMAEEAEGMVGEAEKGMRATESTVEALISLAAGLESFAKEISERTERINTDMDGVLESLQFQDITRQIIEGCDAMLKDQRAHLASAIERMSLPERSAAERTALRDSIRERLLARSKTKDEKSALSRT